MFHVILIQPLFNLLVILYQYVAFGDLGIAIIALTIFIRLILYPVFYKGIKSQMVMQRMQPEMKRVQEQYKNDKGKQAEMMMALYKQYQINPFSSIFYTFIQLPLLWAVYRIFLTGITPESLKDLYSFIAAPASVNPLFLGLVDITKPNLIIVGIAVIVSFIQSYMLAKQTATRGQTSAANKYLVYLAPVLTLLILPKLPAGIGLYWATTAVFSIFQQMAINKQISQAPH
jgi:YidC/Oxa1 family membrane protein insertase